ncbi:MAG TPA: hypothetical protein VNA20_09805 [Frankiaceae bacterium]|nr:hypothetical protein [Frankiaceae bacterium]
MPAVETRNEQQHRTFPPPLRTGLGLVSAGVERARNINVMGLATLPLKGIGAVMNPRRTAGKVFEEVTEVGGALLERVNRLRNGDKPAEPAEQLPTQEEVAEMVEQVTDPFGLSDEVAQQVEDATPGATMTHDQLPLEDYDHLTLGSLRARLSKLDAVSLVQLRDYERAHANRLPVLTMLENRIARLANQPQ